MISSVSDMDLSSSSFESMEEGEEDGESSFESREFKADNLELEKNS